MRDCNAGSRAVPFRPASPAGGKGNREKPGLCVRPEAVPDVLRSMTDPLIHRRGRIHCLVHRNRAEHSPVRGPVRHSARYWLEPGTGRRLTVRRILRAVGGDANAETIGWVETFVPKSAGEKYLPHVTVGVAPEAFVKQLKAEPFEAFTFKPDGVAVYQLGNFGTAAKKLWQSRGK